MTTSEGLAAEEAKGRRWMSARLLVLPPWGYRRIPKIHLPRPGSAATKIEFIGKGNLGNSAAVNLVKAGRQLTVHDLRREAAINLQEMGAGWADRPAGWADRPAEWADRPAERADRPAEWADRPAEWADRPKEWADRPKEAVRGNGVVFT